MAITAKFSADFSEFSSEVVKAEQELKGFEQTTTTTGTAITRMGTTTTTTAPKVTSLTTAYKSFDGVLSAMGVNIGPVVRGIEDIGAASGKTAGQLGTLGTAGLVAGSAMAGWKIGRLAVDTVKGFYDIDKSIAENVSAWMGWGDMTAMVATTTAATLARASAAAGRTITDMTEAVRILTVKHKEHNQQAKEDAEALKLWEAATEEVVIASQNWRAVLETLNPKTIEAAKYALEHGVSQTSVATAYKLSKSEIAAVVSLMDDQIAKLKELEKWNALVADAIATHWGGVGTVIDRVFGMDALQKATTWTDAIDTMGGSVQHLRATELEELNQTMLAGIDALARSGQLTSQQSSRFAELAIAAQSALEAMRPVVTVTEDLAKAQWDYAVAIDEANAANARARDEAKKKAAEDAAAKAKKKSEGGVLPDAIISTGGVVRDLFGRPVVPGGAISNLPTVNINITQPLGTPQAIAEVVGNAVMQSYGRGGFRFPI